jgi:hypothetical protein
MAIDYSKALEAADGYSAARQKIFELQGGSHIYNPVAAEGQLAQYGQVFVNNFRDLVGRDPTPQEADQFYLNVVAPQGSFPGGAYPGLQELSDRTKSFISDTFKPQAEEVANQKIIDQKSVASRLADVFITQGNKALSDTEDQLQDYQSRLFEKLRPQLMTSLQAQGLLNTGALNDAFAGAAKDLSDASQQYLIDQKLQNENQANAIAFGGESAPYQFNQSSILNSVPNLMNAGQSALDRAFNTRSNELAYNYNLGLQDNAAKLQDALQPSFGRTLTQSLATSLGSNLGKFGDPGTYYKPK